MTSTMTRRAHCETATDGAHIWYCVCGEQWFHFRHKARVAALCGKGWNGSPALMVPHRQWCRENLPNSRECTVAGDDGFLRFYTEDDPLGYVAPVEWKSRGAELDRPTANTFRALSQGRALDAIVIRLLGKGNTPGRLQHYPLMCEHVGVPEVPVIATGVSFNGVKITGAELPVAIRAHFRRSTT